MSKPKTPWFAFHRRTALAAAALGVAAAAEIFIYGDIGESWWEETVSASEFVTELNELDVDDITVRINSLGGSVPDGLAIYNAMRRHRANITVEIDGMALSIASLIAMGGDTVRMASNAVMMIHAPWTYAGGNSVELREKADELDIWAAAMSTSYASRTEDKDAIAGFLTDGKDHFFTAAQALELKLIDAITDENVGAAVTAAGTFPLNRYRSLPATLQAAGSPAAAAASSADEDPMKLRTFLLLNAIGASGAAAAGGGSAAAPAPAPVAAPVASPDAAAILAADKQRREGIRAMFANHLSVEGVGALQASCEDDHAVTPEAAGTRLLAHIGRGMSPVAGGRVLTIEDERDKFRSAMTQALLARASVAIDKTGPVRADGSNPYRGRRLLAIAETCLIQAGRRVDGMDPREIVAAAFTQSTSDFPILLENVMHKTLLSAYALQPDTWTRFCARGSVSDFRPHKRYRTGSLGNLDAKNELGEYKNKTIPDGERASIAAGTKGNIINISRETIINDDLSAFTGLSLDIGRAAKRTVEADVYATLALNAGLGPLLEDGKTLFHADHGNIAAAPGAPSVATFEAARVQLASQKDVSGNDFLDLTPDVWLGPAGISGQAKVVINSTYDPDANNKLQRANVAASMVRDIVDTPRLAGTAWYMFADPNIARVLEVAFLDGNDVPYLELETAFNTDGARWKVRLDYGVAGIDYRGAVRNAG
jgi:ATP-dependent protease ClpP protease subunit